MKYSEAMLQGYSEVGGQSVRGAMFRIKSGKPVGACAMGAVQLGGKDAVKFAGEFIKAWGVSVIDLNDEERLPWEHIYGMARAAGL